MRVEKDFEELLKLFNKHEVRYCIVGAFALAFHARPRYTKDMDILVEPTVENGEKIVRALNEFGFGSLKLTPSDFDASGQFIQLGQEPIRMDLITSIPGCTFQEIWKNKQVGKFGTEKVFFIGLSDLIKNKKKVSRKQDLADLEVLSKIKSKK